MFGCDICWTFLVGFKPRIADSANHTDIASTPQFVQLGTLGDILGHQVGSGSFHRFHAFLERFLFLVP